MRRDLEIKDRHPAGFRWAAKMEAETGIHNLCGLRWTVESCGVCGCDTSWMLAYAGPKTWRSARSLVLRSIAGLKNRADVKLDSTISEDDRARAKTILAASSRTH